MVNQVIRRPEKELVYGTNDFDIRFQEDQLEESSYTKVLTSPQPTKKTETSQ